MSVEVDNASIPINKGQYDKGFVWDKNATMSSPEANDPKLDANVRYIINSLTVAQLVQLRAALDDPELVKQIRENPHATALADLSGEPTRRTSEPLSNPNDPTAISSNLPTLRYESATTELPTYPEYDPPYMHGIEGDVVGYNKKGRYKIRKEKK